MTSEPGPGGDFAAAVARLAELHAADPRTEGGEPHSVVYHRRMARWLDRLEPDASEELRLAVRAQHVERWKLPREDFPEGRSGYFQWRTAAKRMHADTAARVMAEAGYGEASRERVRRLLLKRGLTKKVELREAETQTLEDVICVVFLEGYLEDFTEALATGDETADEEKLIRILRKTWRKMSERGRSAALGLDLPPEAAELVARALAPEAGDHVDPAGD